jgi:hypothetical protein
MYSSVGRAGSDLCARRVTSDACEETEYVLDATLEAASLGGVGGASFAGTAGAASFLNDLNETFELYPLSAFANGFKAGSRDPEITFPLSPVPYPESKDLGACSRTPGFGELGSGSNKSSSTAICLLVVSNVGEAGGEFSNENGLSAKS